MPAPAQIFDAPKYTNAIGKYEISLRGLQITRIENLGVTRDAFALIDLSNNLIRVLENIPKLRSLWGILLQKNRIFDISPSVASNIPDLVLLDLAHNQITSINQLEPLQAMRSLTYLNLTGNPVCKTPEYRLRVIKLLPKVRVLDFEKVRDADRTQARDLQHASLANAEARPMSESDTAAPLDKEVHIETKEELRDRLMNATSLEEIDEIEAKLRALEAEK